MTFSLGVRDVTALGQNLCCTVATSSMWALLWVYWEGWTELIFYLQPLSQEQGYVLFGGPWSLQLIYSSQLITKGLCKANKLMAHPPSVSFVPLDVLAQRARDGLGWERFLCAMTSKWWEMTNPDFPAYLLWVLPPSGTSVHAQSQWEWRGRQAKTPPAPMASLFPALR